MREGSIDIFGREVAAAVVVHCLLLLLLLVNPPPTLPTYLAYGIPGQSFKRMRAEERTRSGEGGRNS